MVHAEPVLPAGHGEVLCRPAFPEWARWPSEPAAAAAWYVRGRRRPPSRAAMRSRASEALAERLRPSRRGSSVPVDAGSTRPSSIVMTGHQPRAVPPGRVDQGLPAAAARRGDRRGRARPRRRHRRLRRSRGRGAVHDAGCRACSQYLAVGARDACYAGAAVPERARRRRLLRSADAMLATLTAPAVRRHFSAFCEQLRRRRSRRREPRGADNHRASPL